MVGFIDLFAQHRLMIPDPYAGEGRLDVYALEKSYCVVNSGYGMVPLESGRFFFEEADSFSEGYLEVNRPQGYVSEGKRSTRFVFSTKVKASRDYEDCYVVLRLFSQDGREFLLPYGIEDLKAGRVQRIEIDPQLGVEINRGVYYYHFFSAGQEIYYALTQQELGKRRRAPIALNYHGSRAPALDRLPDADLPAEVRPSLAGCEALVALGVNDSGFSVDHLVLASTNPDAGQMAVNLLKRSRFKPAAESGHFVRGDLLVRVVFDSGGGYRLLEE
ncbi:hypothetical protein [Pelagicoccus sp. SDUM812003]|uniref:hypothetical protein n=1 Tax=Pelagicoccus sp. SDUM812003 TaxID=3041267 RepID=UPI00280D5C1F|nr:hypothetical protein [Pelagicoccus sp. SDUM812003]MDQ8204052.1 hypothetical protein [Pelagicoccus sp. SDUM812003]